MSARLRIVLVGQAAFGEKTIERIAPKHDVVAVYAPPDREGRPPDPLKVKAESLGIPVFQPRSMKGDDVHRQFVEHRADLGVLAYVTVIVPDRVISTPRLGTICFHPSLLPRYRGGSAVNWQLIRGETRGGLTVFWTDAGVDTGPILLQREVEIGPDDTAGSLYFEKIFPIGIDAMEEAVDRIAAGDAPRTRQDEATASHDPLCRDEHVGIHWSRPGREIYDLVRGADPQPGAWALLDGTRVRFYDARLEAENAGPPGLVEEVSANGVRIALADGALVAGRLRIGDGPKTKAGDLAEAGAIEPGTRLTDGGES